MWVKCKRLWCVLCSHQQKLQNIKQKLKEAESGDQDAPLVEILNLFVIFVGYSILKTSSFCHLFILCWRVERTRLVSRPTWRNTAFNASHLVRPVQLHRRYCLPRDWPLISQDVHSMPHLSFGTVCLQKSCCAIRNIVLKDILRHPCLIAVIRPSDRYLTSASAAFCRHTWRFINLLTIIIGNFETDKSCSQS